MTQNPSVLVGITGSVAAYKAAELVRRIMDLGAEVDCVMTEAATRFVTPLTFQTLSRNPVHVDAFDSVSSWNAEHVALADKARLVVICPATANMIGKIAAGIADDLLTTLVMAAATRVPILICPAMNHYMVVNPIVQGNIKKLRDLGTLFVDPEEGVLASGTQGHGRLASLDAILERIKSLLSE